VKILSSSDERLVFEFNRRERQALSEILRLYPVLNPDYHQITKGSNEKKVEEGQKWLREAMAEQRTQNQKMVGEFLADENWKEGPAGKFQVALDAAKTEWLLQVINDVRVGSWVNLGKPDPEQGETVEPSMENLPYVMAMELAGMFQSIILQALEK
jgi:hypothetical protein